MQLRNAADPFEVSSAAAAAFPGMVPATREATLVHSMDKLGSFDRIERELPDGQAWSRFDRGIDSAAYFRSRAA